MGRVRILALTSNEAVVAVTLCRTVMSSVASSLASYVFASIILLYIPEIFGSEFSEGFCRGLKKSFESADIS